MKNLNKTRSWLWSHLLPLLLLLLILPMAQAQVESEDHRGLQKVGNTFESVWLIDNQTVLVPLKGVVEMDILHRFGTVNNGYEDFLGIYAPSNIRIGFSYVPVNKLQLGFGFTKDRLLWDFSAKYAILQEGGESNSPISLTYYGNMGVDTRKADLFYHNTDRLTYFHQLMIARKVTRDFSVQAAASLSHFNAVEAYINTEPAIEGRMKNDHIAVSLLGRYKLSDAFALIANYDQPITKHLTDNPNPNISFGFEVASPAHAFQVFVGNYRWIVPQYNNVLNHNDYRDGAFLIGFNITRLWDLETENMGNMLFGRKNKAKH